MTPLRRQKDEGEISMTVPTTPKLIFITFQPFKKTLYDQNIIKSSLLFLLLNMSIICEYHMYID